MKNIKMNGEDKYIKDKRQTQICQTRYTKWESNPPSSQNTVLFKDVIETLISTRHKISYRIQCIPQGTQSMFYNNFVYSNSIKISNYHIIYLKLI